MRAVSGIYEDPRASVDDVTKGDIQCAAAVVVVSVVTAAVAGFTYLQPAVTAGMWSYTPSLS
jgi:hypothetical protein